MFDSSESTARVANTSPLERREPEDGAVDATPVTDASTPAERALSRVEGMLAVWRDRSRRDTADQRWLLHVPDVGPSCEAILADQVFFDLKEDERAGLMDFIRGSQSESGAWLDVHGRPDLSLTALGWWARVSAGDDRTSESMIRAVRVVHAMGGIQRANFQVRLWMAMGAQLPWAFLPAIPSELFLLPPPLPISPWRFSPWARGMLTPYLLIARAPAHLQLPDASELILRRNDGTSVVPRLTRNGLAGDLLQAFDRTVKLARKFPRGPLPRQAAGRALSWIDEGQQAHGGWFSFRPTLASLIALRVMGATSNDPRIRRGLDHLRRSRGLARIPGTDRLALAQGLCALPMATTAQLLADSDEPAQSAWLLRQELAEPGPWQMRAESPIGGWPLDVGGGKHLDLEATCSVLDALAPRSRTGHLEGAAWSSTRRSIDVLFAMQERGGGFSRFERGESDVFLERFPWTDADLLAFGTPDDAAHLRLSAKVLTQLGRTGFRMDDDRVARGVAWVERTASRAWADRSIETLAVLARCVSAVCPRNHPLKAELERRLRTRQREDGSFGTIEDTARALCALLDLGEPCVQVGRATKYLTAAVHERPDELLRGIAVSHGGFGLSRECFDPSAAARLTAAALRRTIHAGRRGRR